MDLAGFLTFHSKRKKKKRREAKQKSTRIGSQQRKEGKKQGREEEGNNHNKKVNLDTDFTRFTKIIPKWIIDLSVQCKTVKFSEDNIEKKSVTLSIVMTF